MIEETHLLCDRLQTIIDDAVALVESNSLAEKRKQLQQITATIENLEKIGVTVPQELAALADGLTNEVAQHDVAAQTLTVLHERLGGLADSIEPYTRGRTSRKRIRRGDIPETTDQEVFHPVIIEVLRDMGGKGTASQVLDSVFERMEMHLLPGDLEMYPNSDCENWRRNAKMARYELIEKGVLQANSPRRWWVLTDVTERGLGDHQ